MGIKIKSQDMMRFCNNRCGFGYDFTFQKVTKIHFSVCVNYD